MDEKVIKNNFSEQAANYFENGYHCAEAIVAATLGSLGEDHAYATSLATAFGGGVGRTFEETCGALTGSLIAIGHLHGRKTRGDSWDVPAELGANIRQLFIKHFGTTHCASLRNKYDEADQVEACRNIVKTVADDLALLLTKVTSVEKVN